jgi:hypothetical protein
MMQTKPISLSISRAALISLLLLMALGMKAQSKKKMMVQPKDTIPTFRGVAVSVDLVGAGERLFGSYGQYEGALRVNLKDKYFPIIELGLGSADEEDVSTRLHYKTSAPYGRIGIDFNVLKNVHDDYRLYLGGRYAFTSFKYDIFSPGLTDPVWGDHVDYNYPDNSASYHWLEFVGGIDAKIWKFFRLGWSVRYRRRLFHTEQEIGEPWYIPGFGKASNSRLGASFNVIFEF